jgi:hypothetical protein
MGYGDRKNYRNTEGSYQRIESRQYDVSVRIIVFTHFPITVAP